MPRRSVAILCAYLGPLALLPLITARQDPDTQWHARQGLLMTIVELAVLVGLSVVAGAVVLTNVVAGIATLVALWLLWVGIVALHCTAIVVALNGGRLRLPWVSTLAELRRERVMAWLERWNARRVRHR
jgi:uncharacterized membrane protein